ncbi:MAG TPA: hypothetical protein VM537_06030, partial [Anaerolineae bacterium]|nr:hypothetical protein [Anaerolineae bacterium]
YLAIVPALQHLGIGIRLLVKTRSVLKRRGVRYVRGNVLITNLEAVRAAQSMGAYIHAPYAMCFTDLGE